MFSKEPASARTAKVVPYFVRCQMIDESEFRRVMGHFATGVAVVTSCRDDGAAAGLTVSAVSSVSLRPMLVLACVDKASQTHALIQQAGYGIEDVTTREADLEDVFVQLTRAPEAADG